jgi:hypothetical protein
MKDKIPADPVKFRAEIYVPAMAQYLGIISNIKAFSAFSENKVMKAIKHLTIEDKGKAPHPSCSYTK